MKERLDPDGVDAVVLYRWREGEHLWGFVGGWLSRPGEELLAQATGDKDKIQPAGARSVWPRGVGRAAKCIHARVQRVGPKRFQDGRCRAPAHVTSLPFDSIRAQLPVSTAQRQPTVSSSGSLFPRRHVPESQCGASRRRADGTGVLPGSVGMKTAWIPGTLASR